MDRGREGSEIQVSLYIVDASRKSVHRPQSVPHPAEQMQCVSPCTRVIRCVIVRGLVESAGQRGTLGLSDRNASNGRARPG
jgi:hypothetical protein